VRVSLQERLERNPDTLQFRIESAATRQDYIPLNAERPCTYDDVEKRSLRSV
jgi:hypothetical protein